MITVNIVAPCPNCRIAIDDWKIKWAKSKTVIKRGELWPKSQKILHDPVMATKKCNSCKTNVSYEVVLVEEKDGLIWVADLVPESRK